MPEYLGKTADEPGGNEVTKTVSRNALQGMLLGLAAATLPATLWAQVASPTAPAAAPVVTQTAPAAPAAPNVPDNSTVAELQKLIQDRVLNEMRTTYNGRYGASLLFKPDSLSYYVALFHQRNFWRVVKTDSEAQAEQLYQDFVKQTQDLASVDIQRIRLDAERARTARLIETNEGRLTTLQNDLLVRQRQEEQVAASQQQARQQAAELANQQRAAREELLALERRIQTLEAQTGAQADVPNVTRTRAAARPTQKVLEK